MDPRGELKPARRRGLASEVADRLREAIYAGVYAPGAPLREVELSAALEVSRGPVREALLVLEREGLVQSRWHRGTTVTRLTAADAAELHSLRGALEELAVSRVAGAGEARLSPIAEVVTRMADTSDAHAMVGLDIAFHDALYAAAGHRRLEQAWQGIRCQVHLFLLTRLDAADDDYTRHVSEEHQELLTALRTADTKTATALFDRHREHAYTLLSTTP
ncbi:MAG: GntR family transcriptional regulator [Streptosporangiales bacterium]|nr:GntR family transcriptional regulator [Streptosporangiales bacterium]